jgi:hypothetical protein
MPLNSSQALEFSNELIEWFWNLGISRKGSYKLSCRDWLRELYMAHQRVVLVEQSETNLRPAFALWGPSQAGKSTLLSNFLDERVWGNLQPEDKVDATKSGLCFPGSEGCVFFVDLPKDQMHRAEGLVSMNPFTGGRDASAVLTRFVRGSLSPGPGAYHVEFPKYPVELRFLGETQVLHALAMGYDSECLGRANPERPKDGWQQKEWSQGEFVNELDRFNLDFPVPETAPVNRQAFEIILCLCDVLEDLVLARVRRFQKLALSARTEDWQGMIYSLLEQKSLLASAKNAREFVARVLWDGSPLVSEYYEKLLRMLAVVQERTAGKTVHTSLRVATQLLDMDTYDLVARNRRALPRICSRVEGKRVFVELDTGTPLIQNVEDFGLLQGLVWEIMVPVNFDNLSPSPFTRFLSKGDLLDFPGVANESANDVKRIAVWTDMPEELSLRLDKEQKFSPQLFFSKILKRGKTASIVSTYAKRLTIDGFTIFLYLDKYPPVNADQIQSGINTWWSCMSQGYDEKLGGKSPLPLNLALTWWKGLFDEYKALERQGQEYFTNKTSILRSLGRVSNPGVVWSSCALNYYKYDRGKPADDFIPTQELFRALLKEREILLQFGSKRIRESLEATMREFQGKSEENLKPAFDSWLKRYQEELPGDGGLETLKVMLEDRDKGGSAHLLTMLAAQLDEMAKGSQLNRAKILELSKQREAERLERLLQGEFIFPPPEAKDIRRENLQKFKAKLEEATTRKVGHSTQLRTEDEMRPVNQALRELLNVDYVVLDGMPTNSSINKEFILRQYQNWIRKQTGRWRGVEMAGASAPPYWNLLGITSQVIVESYLNSLVDSLKPAEIEETARWLRQDVRVSREDSIGAPPRSDHRRFLAVKMSNLLIGNYLTDYDGESKPPSYAVLIESFLTKQLPKLMVSSGQPLVKVDVPGTVELKALCARYNVPTSAPEPAPNA